MIQQINQLLHNASLQPITQDHLTNDDVWVIKRDGKRVIGFIWVGLMANGSMGYIDRFVVHPEYRSTGVARSLRDIAFTMALARGVKEVHGFIRQSGSHDPSAMCALKVAMSGDSTPYTYVSGQLDFMNKELEAHHGRQ